MAMMAIAHKHTALPYEQGNRSHPCSVVLRTQSHGLSSEDSMGAEKPRLLTITTEKLQMVACKSNEDVQTLGFSLSGCKKGGGTKAHMTQF